MTNKSKEKALRGFQAMAADLQPDELPKSLLGDGPAMEFYRKAAEAGSTEEAFLALYNAFGTLIGFRSGVMVMAEVLGCEMKQIRAAVARIRRDDGDGDLPARDPETLIPTEEHLAILKREFRRGVMESL